MASKFFGALMIVAGTFVIFAGGCLVLIAGPVTGGSFGLLALGIGVALIILGGKLFRASGRS